MKVLLLSLILHSMNPHLMPMWLVVLIVILHAIGSLITKED